MKFKLTAGAELDLLTRHELRHELQAWQAELVRGMMPVEFKAQAAIAGGALVLDGTNGTGRMGPDDGMAWLVTRIAVVGLDNANDKTSVYLGNVNPLNVLYPGLTGSAGATGYHEFQGSQGIVKGGQSLIIASTAALTSANGTNVSAVGGAWEVPIGLLWKLLV